MRASSGDRRERLRGMLADLKMPGALEAVDGILAEADSGAVTAAEAIEKLLASHIVLRNNRRLETAMRSSRQPAIQTLAQFDFAFQPSIKRDQIESLHTFREARGRVALVPWCLLECAGGIAERCRSAQAGRIPPRSRRLDNRRGLRGPRGAMPGDGLPRLQDPPVHGGAHQGSDSHRRGRRGTCRGQDGPHDGRFMLVPCLRNPFAE